MELGSSQELALSRVSEWARGAPKPEWCTRGECLGDTSGDERPHTHGFAHDYPVLSIGGLAGTGKTALAGQLAGRLSVRASFGTPTNKAAHVLKGKLPFEQQSRCGTYHSLLYLPKSWHTCLASGLEAEELQCACGLGFDHDDCSCPRFHCLGCGEGQGRGAGGGCAVEGHLAFEPRLHAGGFRDLIVLDEASMITEESVQDMRRFGLPILLIGDHGQLPPVKGLLSPWMLQPDVVLEENFRQQEASGIVKAALLARRAGTIAAGKYGDGTLVANGSSRPELYEAMLPHRLPPGPGSGIVTWTNKSRAGINHQVHRALAASRGHDDSSALVEGDRLVMLGRFTCELVKRRGDGGWKPQGAQSETYNGQAASVLEVLRQGGRQGKGWADAVLALEDAGNPSKPVEERAKVLRRLDLGQLGADRQLRPDERVPGSAAADYGYALTAHKAQGSEFDRVVVVGQGPSGPDRARWLYTAMTRAKSKLIVII